MKIIFKTTNSSYELFVTDGTSCVGILSGGKIKQLTGNDTVEVTFSGQQITVNNRVVFTPVINNLGAITCSIKSIESIAF